MIAEAQVAGSLGSVALRGAERVHEELPLEGRDFVVERAAPGLEAVVAEKADIFWGELVRRVAINGAR